MHLLLRWLSHVNMYKIIIGLLIVATLTVAFFVFKTPSHAELILYGRELISNTAFYLGPEGTVAQVSNGMNCQNCHLDAGTKPGGNNYEGVSSTYPKYRERSGTVESIEKKINDCLERSLNGKPIDSTSREMQAMVAYMHWVGRAIPKGTKPTGAGIRSLPYLARAADPVKGHQVFVAYCQSCHGANGEGQADRYPPLWGPHSFNTGAGIYRISKMAAFVKDNMPFGASRGKTVLTDEQAWDVAAFINSQPRPQKDISHDWPNIATKPVDHPFGPFVDSFSERQHKFGPFGEIRNEK
jgi:thiosulfate dehydrogenase